MSNRTAPLKFAPPGLIVDGHETDAGGLVVHAHGVSSTSPVQVAIGRPPPFTAATTGPWATFPLRAGGSACV